MWEDSWVALAELNKERAVAYCHLRRGRQLKEIAKQYLKKGKGKWREEENSNKCKEASYVKSEFQMN